MFNGDESLSHQLMFRIPSGVSSINERLWKRTGKNHFAGPFHSYRVMLIIALLKSAGPSKLFDFLQFIFLKSRPENFIILNFFQVRSALCILTGLVYFGFFLTGLRIFGISSNGGFHRVRVSPGHWPKGVFNIYQCQKKGLRNIKFPQLLS